MRPFDCLSEECPVLGPHLLEASAGTGKTFAIEHVFVRLLLEASLEVEQILIVTFTRAATRDLKKRLRKNLEEALQRLLAGTREWGYLTSHFGSKKAEQILSDAAGIFDRSQIFTIHGFCFQMLQEFAFEAGLGFTLPDPDRATEVSAIRLRRVRKFLENEIGTDLLCIEQLSSLLKTADSLDELGRQLLKREGAFAKFHSFKEVFEQYQNRLLGWKGEQIEESKLLEDFQILAAGCKAGVKGGWICQIKSLAASFSAPSHPLHFRSLLKEQGSLFAYLDPSNRKRGAQAEDGLHYPQFFEWAAKELFPLIRQAMDRKGILRCLQEAWRRVDVLEFPGEGLANPDEILEQMRQASKREIFAERVKEKYRAVLIDEFQDTDALQWEIFQSLFLDNCSLKALYLVGDPKQSIYRFRSADIYTYFLAKGRLEESAHFSLDTNYRSSPDLVGALNALFARSWLFLPKMNQTLACPPVKAGAKAIESPLADGKGALHILIERGLSDAFETTLLPFAATEIERLRIASPSIALLVKDRHQTEAALRLLQSRSIPVAAKSHIPLGKTPGFRSARELFEALAAPSNLSLQRGAQAGPFREILQAMRHRDLSRESLIDCCRKLMDCETDPQWQWDLKQLIEEILAYEARAGFSIEGILQFLKDLEGREVEEGARRYRANELGAVQILTLHASKGLEFDIVFAMGITTRSPEADEESEEFNAEKFRQLYVAMTRAKLRLYVPLFLGEKPSSRGALSPMELFRSTLEAQEGPLIPFLERLSKTEKVTFEELAAASLQTAVDQREEAALWARPLEQATQLLPKPFSPCYLQSFTSLASIEELSPRGEEILRSGNGRQVSCRRPLDSSLDPPLRGRDCAELPVQPLPLAKQQEAASDGLFTPHTIPRGTDTGVAIHQIFERLFKSPLPLWRNPHSVDALIDSCLAMTALLPWQRPIKEMVWNALNHPLPCSNSPFSLSMLEPDQLQAEMAFFFPRPPHYVKGFIDLSFIHKGKYYFVDWKTNWLGDDNDAYQDLHKTMMEHDYQLQAAIYTEALRRHVKRFYTAPFEEIFGGALYFFLRGDAVYTQIYRT